MSRTKTDYTTLDSTILAALRDGPMHFTELFKGDVHTEALLHASRHSTQNPGLPKWQRKTADRFLDARLQALRKSGRIYHTSRHGWQLETN